MIDSISQVKITNKSINKLHQNHIDSFANKLCYVSGVYFCFQMCLVVDNYEKSLKDCNENPEKYRKSIDMTKYELPKGSWT